MELTGQPHAPVSYTHLNEISEQLFVLDKAYIKYKSQNYITFTYGSASFLQRLSLKKDVYKRQTSAGFTRVVLISISS